MLNTHIELHDKTWFRTGGLAQYYAEPDTAEKFQKLIMYAQEKRLHIVMLGEGANILISDDGFTGLVIKPLLTDLSFTLHDTYALVTAGAGASFTELINYSLNHQLLGLEEFSGIPGTVGGAVYMNIHYFRYLLSDFVVAGTVINSTTGEIMHVNHSWFSFGYNQSELHHGKYYLINATFKLRIADLYETAYARGRSQEIIRHRQQRYPKERTCGSFFRNFYDHEVTLISNNKKMTYIAYYLDKLGVKGQLSVGKAAVSYQHANMIVAHEGSTSSHVVELARTMQQLVYDEFGIIPHAECQFIGFETYPLLTGNPKISN